MRRTPVLAACIPLVLTTAVWTGGASGLSDSSDQQRGATTSAEDAPPSTYVGTTEIERRGTVSTQSDGDLWPSCWADDGALYTANGDGKGFSLDEPFADIAVNEVHGSPPNLTGETVSRGDQVGQIWSGPGYNRKPTGMVCVGDTLYLAVQDLALDFNDVPAATIVKSVDGGRTWTWDRSEPMFDNHEFTTIWFADFGQGGRLAPDGYVYAYGLDNNWRDSFDDTVEDPQDVFLARVPEDRVQDRGAWKFYSGRDGKNRPTWSGKIDDRQPVLHDGRRLYEQMHSGNQFSRGLSVISQGGVTYVPQLDRYIYASWTEFTFEFYESPTPWGPWRHFASKDFGGYPWTTDKHGGYATTIPSKFLSPDGRSMWVQSNVCPCGGGGTSVYHYSLRQMQLTPAEATPASNLPDPATNLAEPSTDAVAVSKSSRSGDLVALNDGSPATSEDDFDDEVKSSSWWGYTWPRAYRVNQVEFTSGPADDTGGWFVARPRVQVRQDGRWVDAAGQTISPTYPGDKTAGGGTYTFSFLPAEATGVRVFGHPGGTKTFTSAAEVGARFVTQVVDGGFEAGGPSAWSFEGPSAHGIDRNLGFQRSGQNNAWIRTSGTGFSAYTQEIPVSPGETYTFEGWTKTSGGFTGGRFGVRLGDPGSTVLGEQQFGASASYVNRSVQVTVPPGVDSVTLYAGFEANGSDNFLQLDDISVSPN